MLKKHEIGAIVQQFYFGESDGAKLVQALPAFAPGQHEKEFCKYWKQDEEKHDRLFHGILHEYALVPSGFNVLFEGLFGIAWQCVAEKDWVKCMTIAAVIETIALEAGIYLHENGDEPVQKILEEIIPDEKKHLAFSRTELQKYVNLSDNRIKIKNVVKKVKILSCKLGKEKKFNNHDIHVANMAQTAFLSDMEKLGIHYPNIKNKNGYWRNIFLEIIIN